MSLFQRIKSLLSRGRSQARQQCRPSESKKSQSAMTLEDLIDAISDRNSGRIVDVNGSPIDQSQCKVSPESRRHS